MKRPLAKTIEEVEEFIHKVNKGIEAEEMILWGISTKDSPKKVIGSICLWNFSSDKKTAETGYDLMPAYHGQGLMGEALRAVITYGFQTLQLHGIEAFTQKNNAASLKLLKKNNFVHQTERIDTDNELNLIFTLNKEVNILKNVSLKGYNTFGIDVAAKEYAAVSNVSELKQLLSLDRERFFLGGGSNILLTADIDALVIHLDMKGKQIVSEDEEHVIVKVMAGENWHEFVLWTLQNDFGGVENLSLIPGNVGTAPIQNIGAYGVELKDVFISCETMHVHTLEERTFDLADCQFDYRNSIFKNEAKGQYVITSVNFRLTKKDHRLNTSYGAIAKELAARNIERPTINDISEVVIAIRQSKLPDPKELGNSGSFFKNPVIATEDFKKLQATHPEVPHYVINEHQVKVPAGWLIEQAGFKGKRYGDAGIHEKQALVLVNHGKASGQEIWQLAQKIQSEVFQSFGIAIEAEVNVIK